jgi:hypothetical protein
VYQSPEDLKYFENAPITMRKPKSKAAHGWDRDECLQEEDSMSSPITPPQAAQPVFSTGGSALLAASTGAAGPATVAAAVSLDTLPTSPPQEMLDQMASAMQIHDQLSSQGRELRFARDAQSGRTRIEVRDRGGNVLRTISPAQALEVAAGAPLE